MSDPTSATTHAEQSEAPPPFQPDPELIDHLEGNQRTIKRYRQAAEKLRDDAQEGRSLG